MPKRIAVDDDLDNVRAALSSEGYQVTPLHGSVQGADVVVISGMDTDIAGMKDIQTEAAVINAEGMTADQVVKEVQERLSKRY